MGYAAQMCRVSCRGVDVGTECCEVSVSLIEACLVQDAAARPTAARLVETLEGLQDDAAV